MVLRRVGIESQMKTLKENEIINPKICILRTEIEDKLI